MRYRLLWLAVVLLLGVSVSMSHAQVGARRAAEEDDPLRPFMPMRGGVSQSNWRPYDLPPERPTRPEGRPQVRPRRTLDTVFGGMRPGAGSNWNIARSGSHCTPSRSYLLLSQGR